MRSVSRGELAAMIGVDETFAAEYLPDDRFPALRYSRLEKAERDTVILTALRELERDDMPVSGSNDASRWNRGWGEILDRVRRDGFSEAILRPQYFRHDVVRYRGDYARVERRDFEYEFYRAARELVFRKYLAEVGAIIEFGCGTGTSLALLGEIYPGKTLIGCDWAAPSQELMTIIAREKRLDLRGCNFNMLTLEGRSQVEVLPTTAVITMHAMEQLGGSFGSFLDYLLSKRPALALHLEPVLELYGDETLFDALAIRYHRKRGYLTGFLPALRRLAEAGAVEIVECRRFGIGSVFHEGYSLVVWRAL